MACVAGCPTNLSIRSSGDRSSLFWMRGLAICLSRGDLLRVAYYWYRLGIWLNVISFYSSTFPFFFLCVNFMSCKNVLLAFCSGASSGRSCCASAATRFLSSSCTSWIPCWVVPSVCVCGVRSVAFLWFWIVILIYLSFHCGPFSILL